VQTLVPPGLKLVTHNGQAFWNIVVSTIDKMRPQRMPRWAGITYHHVAYRLQVAAETEAGAPITGLYFLRSDVSSVLVGKTGNWLSDFKLHTSKIDIAHHDDRLDVAIESRESAGNAQLSIDTSDDQSGLQTGLFKDSDEEQAILKYQPLGLAVGSRNHLRLAEVIRDESAWSEARVTVISAQWGFFDDEMQKLITLQRATRVDPLDYRWRLGNTAPLRTHSA
jgi:hypothetical protein